MGKILLILENQQNLKLLAQELSLKHEVIIGRNEADLSCEYDIGVIDGVALDRHWNKIQELKQSALPALMPWLLVTPREDVGYATRHLWKTFEEIIITPIEKVELMARVEMLLRARTLSLEFFRTLVVSAPVAICATSPDLAIRHWNLAAERMFGWSLEEVAGLNLMELLHIEDRRLEAYLKGSSEEKVIVAHETELIGRDGRSHEVEISLAAQRDSRGLITNYIFIINDLSEQRLAERRLSETRELLSTVISMVPAVIYIYDLETEYNVYSNRAVEELTGYAPEELKQIGSELFRKIIHPEDLARVVEFQESLKKASSDQTLEITYRLIHKNGDVKWFHSYERPWRRHSDGRVYQKIGVAVDITQMIKAQQEREKTLQQLNRTLDQVIDAFSSAMELKDPYTFGHQSRVARLACKIAEEMGFTRERVDLIRVASLLHDLGKGLYVPSEILNKPGKLTQLEMSLVKTHPQVGCEVLQKIEMFSSMAKAVLQHHERLDGSGYPQGLRENEIMLEAMIIAVADVVEAMSSHRPYRPALGLEAALNEIKQNSGRLYRSEVVETCLRVFEKGFSFE